MSEAVTILASPSLPPSKVSTVPMVTAPPEPCAGLPGQAHVLEAGSVLGAVLVPHTHRVQGEIPQPCTIVLGCLAVTLNLEHWEESKVDS